jgi:hypothetical protein
MSTTIYYAYDRSARLTTRWVPAGEAHYFSYNQRNMVTGLVDHNGAGDAPREFVYNGLGERAVVKDNSTGSPAYWSYDGYKLLRDREVAGAGFAERSYRFNTPSPQAPNQECVLGPNVAGVVDGGVAVSIYMGAVGSVANQFGNGYGIDFNHNASGETITGEQKLPLRLGAFSGRGWLAAFPSLDAYLLGRGRMWLSGSAYEVDGGQVASVGLGAGGKGIFRGLDFTAMAAVGRGARNDAIEAADLAAYDKREKFWGNPGRGLMVLPHSYYEPRKIASVEEIQDNPAKGDEQTQKGTAPPQDEPRKTFTGGPQKPKPKQYVSKSETLSPTYGVTGRPSVDWSLISTDDWAALPELADLLDSLGVMGWSTNEPLGPGDSVAHRARSGVGGEIDLRAGSDSPVWTLAHEGWHAFRFETIGPGVITYNSGNNVWAGPSPFLYEDQLKFKTAAGKWGLAFEAEAESFASSVALLFWSRTGADVGATFDAQRVIADRTAWDQHYRLKVGGAVWRTFFGGRMRNPTAIAKAVSQTCSSLNRASLATGFSALPFSPAWRAGE